MGMVKKKVLFVCVQNSARSQMAEALMNAQCGDRYLAESAGLEPGELNPLAVEVMREIGIDISTNETRDVLEVFKQGRFFHYVVTVCDTQAAERCPIFPGAVDYLHWSFPDPAGFGGDEQQRLKRTREVRDAIAAAIREWCPAECENFAA